MTSSNRSGRLSAAEGSRKPCSTRVSLRLRSPMNWPWSWGTATWGLVDDGDEVIGEVVEQGERPLTRGPPVDVAGVVLDAVAEPDLLHHLQVVGCPHTQPLGFQQLPLLVELGQPLLELDLDALDGPPHPLLASYIVGGREHHHLAERLEPLPGYGVDGGDLLHFVAEQLDADHVLLVGGMDLDDIAPHSEPAPNQVGVVALVLHVHQPAQQVPLVIALAHLGDAQELLILLGRPQPVDTRHRRHHDHVPPGQKRLGGGVAQPVDLVVHRRVLLDVGVGGRHVGLGLVVVVVRHEVLHPVVGEELPHLVGQLGGQRLVGGQHQGGPLHLLDGPRHRGALARPGDAQQRLEPVAPPQPLRQRGNGLGLVSRRVERRHHSKGCVPRLAHRTDATGPSLTLRSRNEWRLGLRARPTPYQAPTARQICLLSASPSPGGGPLLLTTWPRGGRRQTQSSAPRTSDSMEQAKSPLLRGQRRVPRPLERRSSAWVPESCLSGRPSSRGRRLLLPSSEARPAGQAPGRHLPKPRRRHRRPRTRGQGQGLRRFRRRVLRGLRRFRRRVLRELRRFRRRALR